MTAFVLQSGWHGDLKMDICLQMLSFHQVGSFPPPHDGGRNVSLDNMMEEVVDPVRNQKNVCGWSVSQTLRHEDGDPEDVPVGWNISTAWAVGAESKPHIQEFSHPPTLPQVTRQPQSVLSSWSQGTWSGQVSPHLNYLYGLQHTGDRTLDLLYVTDKETLRIYFTQHLCCCFLFTCLVFVINIVTTF